MPTARIQLPDGQIGRFEVPEGMSQQEIEAQISQLIVQPSGGEAPEPQRGREDNSLSSYVPEDSSDLRTIIDRAYNGMTIGNFGDEIQAAGGALAAKGYGLYDKYLGDNKTDLADTPISELYNQGLEVGRNNRDAQFRDNTGLAVLSEIGGSLATGIPAAKLLGSTAAGAKVANTLRSGVLPNAGNALTKTLNLGSKAATGGAIGAATGGLAGFGAGEGGFDERLQSAEEYANTGAVLGAAFPVAASAVKSTAKGAQNVAKGITARGADKLDDAMSSMFASARKSYEEMKKVGATIAPNRAVNIANRVRNSFGDNVLLKANEPKTLSALKGFDEAVRKENFSLVELDNWRKAFNKIVKDGTDITGKMNSDANAARQAVKVIDNAVENLGVIDLSKGGQKAIDALNRARTDWAKASRFQTIAHEVKKANGDPNKLKRALDSLLTKGKKTAGFNEAENAALRNAAEYSTPEGIYKMLGKFGLDIGSPVNMGNTALPTLGGLGAGVAAGSTPVGLGVVSIGTVARQLQKYLARGKAEQLLRVIEQGGTIPAQEVMKLPPKAAIFLMNNNLVSMGKNKARAVVEQ